jgi:arginine/ornithine transport system substrate-binding protein
MAAAAVRSPGRPDTRGPTLARSRNLRCPPCPPVGATACVAAGRPDCHLALPLAAARRPLAQAPDWKKIRIGVEGAYPPFSEVGPDGKLKGFDIDIANALCAQMKAECTLVPQEWDGMIPALQARKFDAIVASMSPSPKSASKAVNFTDKYYNTPSRLVAKAGARRTATAAA